MKFLFRPARSGASQESVAYTATVNQSTALTAIHAGLGELVLANVGQFDELRAVRMLLVSGKI